MHPTARFYMNLHDKLTTKYIKMIQLPSERQADVLYTTVEDAFRHWPNFISVFVPNFHSSAKIATGIITACV